MKNVAVTLSEDVAEWSRVKAAESDGGVSGWVGDLPTRIRSGRHVRDRHEASAGDKALEDGTGRRPQADPGRVE